MAPVAIQTTYRIEGMNHWDEADTIAARLSELDGVNEVRTDIVAGTALVISSEPVTEERVRAALADAGYATAPPRSPLTVPVFVSGLVAALIAGFALAKALPSDAPPQPAPVTHPHSSGAGGLAISTSGYTLVPGPSLFAGPGRHELSFVIKDANGQAVTRYATVHEKQLHLIVVRRDLSGFQHLHPSMAADGTWRVVADLAEAGPWRVYADFTAAGSPALTLGYDVNAAGSYVPHPAAPAANGVTSTGALRTGAPTSLSFSIPSSQSLEEYLAAPGHLVAIREGDLGYVHVHADAQVTGNTVRFQLAAPSPGTYRLFFQYQASGQVHTAEFAQVVG